MILIDTPVFVASFVDSHENHIVSRDFLKEVSSGRRRAIIATHSLAEIYATLSVYPLKSRLLPHNIEFLIQNNVLPHFMAIDLTHTDYRAALRRVIEKRLLSGAIYDSLIYQAAVKGKAKALYTWDQKDFTRLSDGEIEIRTP